MSLTFNKLLGREKLPDYAEAVDELTPEAVAILAEEVAADEAEDREPATPPVVHVESADEKWLRGVKHARDTLAEFRLSPLAMTILERACENVASNTGNGIADDVAKAEIQQRAALFAVADSDLIDVLAVIKEKVPTESVPGMVYSNCFAVQKAANFAANLMYRRALDPADGEGMAAHDHRDAAEPPVGMGPDPEQPLEFNGVIEHPDTNEARHVEILRAYEDLHLYLQLLAELHGWDIDAPMPYLFTQNLDGTFTPVFGAEQALDLMEVRSAQSRIRRTEKRTANLALALAGATEVLKRAGRRAAA